jgi:hypothetical protein
LNYLVYKSKIFIFFEDLFVIKVPLQLKIKVKKRNKDGEFIIDKATKKAVLNEKTLKLSYLINHLSNRDIKIYCIGLEKVGIYYYCPVFITDKGDGVLDYRQFTEGAVIDSTYQIMVSRILNQSAQSMEKAINLNPNIKYNQALPEKTKEEQKQDEQGA